MSPGGFDLWGRPVRRASAIWLGGVDGGLGEKLAVVVDDADVAAVGDQEHDMYAVVAVSDAEVPQLDW